MSNKQYMLEGVKVIEFANFVAGPCCGRILADWGAEVIKIEPDFGDTMRVVGVQWMAPTDEDENPLFENENAGKKGIIVNTNTEEGQKVILVEGIAEELLIGTMAKYLGYSLEDHHVAVINVGGRYFSHFTKLFDISRPYSILKKIACITDRDPCRKEINGGRYFEKCYPYEYCIDRATYEYSENAKENIDAFSSNQTIHFFSQDELISKTFEYDLILHNPILDILVTDSMKNKEEIKDLMTISYNDALDRLKTSAENKRIANSLETSSWGEDEKKKALIASRYLNSVGKGENALELCNILEENLLLPLNERKNFNVPQYIKHAIEWLLQ